ncbi:30S ribosomal protein S16 [bacterium]|nr:30S ribosomal protein S16 [bacterium]
MAVRIRLLRMGSNKRPSYRLVAVDAKSKPQGPYLEMLGYYNPLREPPEIKLDEEKIMKWLLNGAQPSETALSLLKKEGIWDKFLQIKQAQRGGG